jgi:hypothetical protein
MTAKELNKRMLKGEDILLNLRGINICPIDSYSSSTCAGSLCRLSIFFILKTRQNMATWKALTLQELSRFWMCKIKADIIF